MFKTLRFISSEEETPDHNSKILYIKGQEAPVFGMFTLEWAELEDDNLTGEFVDYEDECPDGFVLIGMIDGELVDDDIYWMSVEQFEEVVK